MNKELGQYFTTNKYLQNEVKKLILNNSDIILEPSCGRGDLIINIYDKNKNYDLFEIDKNIILNKQLLNKTNINLIYTDFLSYKINKLYKTIIGNPPYIKKKGTINIYLRFINKCYELLENEGELIFIIPYDFLISTNDYSKKLRIKMLNNGNITHIIHPNNEKLFDNANIDIIILRYLKTKNKNNLILYNNINKYIFNNNGIISFYDININNKKNIIVKDLFDAYVGMVNGCEKIFKNDKLGNINILNSENNYNKYIFINNFPTNNDELNKYMLNNKNILLNRKICKITENNWFKWGCARNIKTIEENLNKDCIYIYNLTRKENISFIGKVNYFSSNLILLIPKNKNLNLKKYNDYFNSIQFKNNYMSSGRFKIGHSQLLNSIIID